MAKHKTAIRAFPSVANRDDLTIPYLKTLLSYDPLSGEFKWRDRFNNGLRAGTVNKEGYMRIQVHKVAFKAHRLAWAFVYGEMPDKSIPIDHINGVRKDNRIANLRLCTSKQNSENAKKPISNTTGFKGVTKYRDKFRAYICHERKHIHLGIFNTPEEGNDAYCEAAKMLGWEVFRPD